jgi:cell division protein FtsN
MARSSRRSTASGLPHLVVGLVLGLAVAAGVYFSDLRSGVGLPEAVDRVLRPSPSASADDSPARPASAQAPARASARESSGGATGSRPASNAAEGRASGGAARTESGAPVKEEPRFDFYEILPQYEVLVPEEVETVARPVAPSAPVAAPGSYVLQTGSFRSHADADRMQASLALLGVESGIQKVAIGDGEFHRVRIGPVSNLDELNRIRTVLRQAGIESLMMKVD